MRQTQAMMNIDISNPEKKIFAKYTKKDLVDYYTKVSRLMLPHIEKRPLTMYRFPDGTGKEGFFQKDMPDYFPHWIGHKTVKKEKGAVDYPVCNSEQCLVYIASQVGEFHIWTSKTGKLHYPDKMIFDLDPPGQNRENPYALNKVKKAARKLGNLLKKIGLKPYLMTTGKRGYHVVVPILPELNNDAVREFALKIAKVLEQDEPENFTIELIKEKRPRDRIFIDVNRNSPHQTAIAPYSVRAVKGATVALPIGWDELGKISPNDYDIKKTLERIKKKPDLWKGFGNESESLKKVIARLKGGLKK